MILTIILSLLAIIGMFVCILKYPVVYIKRFSFQTFYLPILIVALILLIFPIFDKENLINIVTTNTSLNPLKILVLFISVSLMSIALDEAGFFKYIATIFINKYKKSQMALFIVLYLLISILTIFTSNDIVILTFTPFILYFSKRGNIKAIPYLVMEFVAANTYSMLLPIGNPTNIYLTSVFELTFLEYVLKMLLPTILIGISSFTLLVLLFRRDLKKEIEVFDLTNEPIKHKILCTICLIHLATTTILLAISNYIGLEMWLICLTLACSLLLFIIAYTIKSKNTRFLIRTTRRVPYSLIPFVLSMFTIIMALDSYNVFGYVSDLFNMIENDTLKSIVYLISSTLSCNVINNIPMTLAFSSILNGTASINMVYATIIGSNLGAILTPVGALAGIMWINILKQNNVKYTFLDFIKNGAIITLVLLIAGTISLLII